MPASRSTPPRPEAPPPLATLVARSVSHALGGRVVLDDVALTIGPQARIGIVGPNGVGKSTLLRLLAGLEVPDMGSITVSPPGSTVGYLAQEHERVPGESVRQHLTRRTGTREAEDELAAAAAGLVTGTRKAEARYETALQRFTALGAGDLDTRIDATLEDLGLGTEIADRGVSTLSGGQEAKIALAAIELSRFSVTLLDEPTNDLDFAGLRRLGSWIERREGGMVVVSHDRSFLERTVSTVLELDEHDHTAREFGGGWAGYQSERATARAHAEEAYALYQRNRSDLQDRAARQRQWATSGVARETRSPRDNDKAQRDFRINRTEKLASKARQTERALSALEQVAKPWEGWDLQFTIGQVERAGAVVVRLDAAVIERGAFRLGPLDLEIAWGERLGLAGANGTGKTTLVGAVLGEVALASGTRWIGPSVVTGVLGQDRRTLGGTRDLVREVCDRCGVTVSEARSLLAKFGLAAEQVTRPAGTLSPGERTRAELAVFQALGVNFLVLDEPTNHLDLPAIEQLESALGGYTGTLLLVTHDVRLLEAVDLTRTVDLDRPSVG